MASYPYRKTSHSCVPKPWNSASSSGRTWAPIKAPTTSPSSNQLSARPAPTPSLESSPSSSTAYDSSVTTTSLQAQNQASNQLTSALSDLGMIFHVHVITNYENFVKLKTRLRNSRRSEQKNFDSTM